MGSTAVLDSSVLYQAPVRDLLIQLAFRHAYRARWTDRIHEEWITSLLNNRPELTRKQLHYTRKLMDTRVLNCLVENYDHIEKSLVLPDPQDRHVLAAAIEIKAQAIVTFNLKDFPKEYMAQFEIDVYHPDDFLVSSTFSSASLFLECVRDIRARLKSPPVTVKEYLDVLLRQGLVKTVEFLSAYENLI